MPSLVSKSITVWPSEEISLLVEGADLSVFKTGINYPIGHFDDQDETYFRLARAAQEGRILVRWVEVADMNAEGSVNRDTATGLFNWFALSDEDEVWKSYLPSHIRFGVHWREVNKWLKDEFGYKESDIPEAFRCQPWIEDENERGELSSPVVTNGKTIIKGRRQTDQDEAILKVLRDMGYEADKLPKFKHGKDWVKSEIKLKVHSIHPRLFVEGATTFKKSWERLRKAGLIREK